MSDIQLFNFESNQVRVIEVDNQPWFVVKDVCNILDIQQTKTLIERLDNDEVGSTPVIDSTGRMQDTKIISESGLYTAILRSDKSNAKPFQKWVTKEVIPNIRNKGYYITSNNNQDILLKAISELTNQMNDIKTNYIQQVNLLTESNKKKDEQINDYEEEKRELQLVFNEYPGLEKAINYMLNYDGIDYEGFTLREYLLNKPRVRLTKGERISVGKLVNSWLKLSTRFPLTKIHGITIYFNKHEEILDLAIKYVQGLIY